MFQRDREREIERDNQTERDSVCVGLCERAVSPPLSKEREFFLDNLLVRIHFLIVMIRWTGLAPWEFKLRFPGITSTFPLSFFESCSLFARRRS